MEWIYFRKIGQMKYIKISSGNCHQEFNVVHTGVSKRVYDGQESNANIGILVSYEANTNKKVVEYAMVIRIIHMMDHII